jgi:hypothetical protein
VAALAIIPGIASATPKPLPFTYGVDTNPKGQGEVEQYVDLVPLYALNANAGRSRVLATQLMTEVEYGLSNRVELGLYVTLAPTPPGYVSFPSLIERDGAKQRIRWRLADQGDWPIDVALYAEVVENTQEIEIEAKVILEKRFGPLRLLANFWVEHEFYFDGTHQWVFNPTAGFTVQATPNVFPGLEYWMRAEVPATDFNAGPHHYLGPTLRLAFGNFFWTTGLYMRLSNIDRQLVAGTDSFGPIWFRSIVGFGFQ